LLFQVKWPISLGISNKCHSEYTQWQILATVTISRSMKMILATICISRRQKVYGCDSKKLCDPHCTPQELRTPEPSFDFNGDRVPNPVSPLRL
jgi:hypothetical protein